MTVFKHKENFSPPFMHNSFILSITPPRLNNFLSFYKRKSPNCPLSVELRHPHFEEFVEAEDGQVLDIQF